MAEKKICEVCGKEFEEGCAGFCSEHCFEEDFWTKALDGKEIVIGGECYHVGLEDDSPSWFHGYGGARFKIRMNDGRVIETTNLWNQGDIPARFYTGDNAEFIKNS